MSESRLRSRLPSALRAFDEAHQDPALRPEDTRSVGREGEPSLAAFAREDPTEVHELLSWSAEVIGP